MAVRHRSLHHNGSTRNQIGLSVHNQLDAIRFINGDSGFGESNPCGGRRAHLLSCRKALHQALLPAAVPGAQWRVRSRKGRCLLCVGMACPVDWLEGQYHRRCLPIDHALSPDPKQGPRAVLRAELASFLR